MNLLTIEKLRSLNKEFSRKELIDKFYTKKQKNKFKQLKWLTILLLITVSLTFITMLLWVPFFQVYKQYTITTLSGLSFLFIGLAGLIGHTLSRTQRKYSINVLERIYKKEITKNSIRNITEDLAVIRFQRFNDFCKQESIPITLKSILFIKERLMDDLKENKIDNLSFAKKWSEIVFIPFLSSIFSVYIAKCVDEKDVVFILSLAFLFIFVITYLLFILNTWQNNRIIKQRNKYQDLLETIKNHQFKLIKNNSRG